MHKQIRRGGAKIISSFCFLPSNFQTAVCASHPDLLRLRLCCVRPVHCVFHGLAHPGEPPLRARHARARPAINAALGGVESEFELLVGCHNVVLITTPLSPTGWDIGCPSLQITRIIFKGKKLANASSPALQRNLPNEFPPRRPAPAECRFHPAKPWAAASRSRPAA